MFGRLLGGVVGTCSEGAVDSLGTFLDACLKILGRKQYIEKQYKTTTMLKITNNEHFPVQGYIRLNKAKGFVTLCM